MKKSTGTTNWLCLWTFVLTGYIYGEECGYYRTSCGNTYSDGLVSHGRYCPHCGNQIAIVELAKGEKHD